MSGGRGVTIRLVLGLGVAVSVLAYLVLNIWTGQGRALPPTSWGALIVLVFMACGVFFAGLPVRRFLRGEATKPFNPIRAMRTVVLAQASALTGALVTGWYVGQILLLLPDFDIASRRALGWRLAALAAGGVLMAVAGLVVQSMCRLDEDGHNGDRDEDRSSDRSSDRDGGRSSDRHGDRDGGRSSTGEEESTGPRDH